MIKAKEKKCKGTGKAIGHGCNSPVLKRTYGLCEACYKTWLLTTKEGQEKLKKTLISSRKKIEKANKAIMRQQKENIRNKSYYEKQLEKLVNEIVRLIDVDKGCISCDHGWDGNVTRQFHAGHHYSVGSNPQLRYHFYNIFKQCSICNSWKSGNEREYDKGIEKHYGINVLEYCQTLKSKYQELHLTVDELKQAIEIAKGIKKDILSGMDYSRAQLNEILGIYK